MLNIGRRRVFLCRKPVDMRKAFDSLADLVRVELGMVSPHLHPDAFHYPQSYELIPHRR